MAPKSVLITGCSEGGIGDALAQEFHRRGLKVFATARNTSKIGKLERLGIHILPLDVVDEESINKAVASVESLNRAALDILVNNSGAGYSMPLLDTEAVAAKKMFDVNVFGLISVTKAFSPLLIASHGLVINIGSIAGKAPLPWQGYYNASKAAVNLLTDQLRIELAPLNVRVVNVVTGGVKTKFSENLPPAKLPVGSPYAAARDDIEIMMGGAAQGIDVTDYARKVVDNALRAPPKARLWVGSSTSMFWFLDTFFWSSIWDFVLSKPFKLAEIDSKLQAPAKQASK